MKKGKTIRQQIEAKKKEIERYAIGKNIFLEASGKFNDPYYDKLMWELSGLYQKLSTKGGLADFFNR